MKIKRKPLFLAALLLLIILGCNTPNQATHDISPTHTKIFSSLPSENNNANNPPQQPQWQDDTLYLGMMIHLEGWADAEKKGSFEQHTKIVRETASLFESYGAKLTLESKEFTTGCLQWGDNVLLEMEKRGHGIGVHADVGGNKTYACPEMATELRERREELEKLGVTVRHVSGIVSHCDWVNAAVDAGYEFTSGTVEYALMSLPQEKWPEGFEGCANPGACHQAYPPELEDRLHPWRAQSGQDWIDPNPQGELVILPSGGGMICLAEETNPSESPTKCKFNVKNIDALQHELEAALSLVDERRLNMYYFAWSIGSSQDEALLKAFLEQIQPYVDSGQIQWATLPEMYDLYLEWEQSGHGSP
jgi:hypothetical protein